MRELKHKLLRLTASTQSLLSLLLMLSLLLLLTAIILLQGCSFIDLPPIAEAGDPVSGTIDEEVIVSIREAKDPEGKKLIYTWKIDEKPETSSIENSDLVYSGAQVSFIPDARGIYVLQMEVCDGSYTAKDFVIVEITPLPAEETEVPAKAGQASVSAFTSNSLIVNWDPVPRADRYQLFRSQNSDFSASTLIYNGTSREFEDKNLSGGNTYYYQVKGENAAGPGSPSEILEAVTCPYTPGRPVKTDTSIASLKLTWNDVRGADRYELYRDTLNTGTFSRRVYSDTFTSFTDEGLTPGTTYYYKIRAFNESGSSDFAGPYTYTTYSRPPSSIHLVRADSGSIELSWDDQIGAGSYIIYRSHHPDGPYSEAGSSETSAFTDTGLSSGIYYYTVSSVNSAGEGTQSSYLEVEL